MTIHGSPKYPRQLSLLAGLLLVLSFPPVDLAVLQIPAFILLFHVIHQTTSFRELARNAYPGFLIWNLGTTYWLMMATFVGGATAILANAALMLIPLEIMRRLFRLRIAPILIALLTASVWTTYEFAHHHWDLSWPWLTLGNAWSNLPFLIQYISYTGHLAISFWVVASSVLTWMAVKTLERNDFIHALGFIILFPALSWTVDNFWEETPAEEMEVVVVQPNLDSYEPYGGLEGVDQVLDNLLELSDLARTPRTRLIVWPENAISQAIGRDNRFNSRIRDTLSSWQTELITGAGFMEIYDDVDIEEPVISRTTGDGRAWNLYNTGLHYTSNGLQDVYKKGKLVPLVERFPFAETVHALDVFDWIKWESLVGYGKGLHTNNFLIGDAMTPALVCYDSVFPTWVNGFVREGAGFLTIITNDGWWGDTSGHSQHFAYARLRAIEHRQWIVRSANNGISGIISPDGVVRERTQYWTRTAFSHTIYPTDERTFYGRFGNWFGWLMTAGLVAAVSLLLRELRSKRRLPESADDQPLRNGS